MCDDDEPIRFAHADLPRQRANLIGADHRADGYYHFIRLARTLAEMQVRNGILPVVVLVSGHNIARSRLKSALAHARAPAEDDQHNCKCALLRFAVYFARIQTLVGDVAGLIAIYARSCVRVGYVPSAISALPDAEHDDDGDGGGHVAHARISDSV